MEGHGCALWWTTRINCAPLLGAIDFSFLHDGGMSTAAVMMFDRSQLKDRKK